MSQISGVQYIDRGYEKLVPKLQGLGADVERVSEPVAVEEDSDGLYGLNIAKVPR